MIFTGKDRSTDTSLIFFAPKLMLAIQIDGETHRFKGPEDEERQRDLEALGVRFLRLADRDVKRDAWAMAQVVDQWIEAWERGEKID